MSFKSTVNLIQFDKRAYLDELNKEMTEITKEAAKKWLRVVTAIVPTWSQASLATFDELARAVGYNISYGPQKSIKNRKSLGLDTGRGGLHIQKDHRWHFFYETDLRYLRFNEFNTATVNDGSGWFSTHRDGPGPYRFQEAGASEFKSFAQQVKLPNPIKFIKPKKI